MEIISLRCFLKFTRLSKKSKSEKLMPAFTPKYPRYNADPIPNSKKEPTELSLYTTLLL